MVARQQVRRMLLGGVMGLAALAFVAIPPASARSSVTVRTISFSSPLVALGVDQAAGVAVVAGGDKARRRVSLLDARTGAPRFGVTLPGVLWTPVEIGPASSLAIDEQHARAYMTTYAHIGRYGPTRGYVNVIDTQHGTLLNTVPSPPAGGTGKSHLPGRPGLPVFLTVDSHTGRLFVINSNLPSPRPTGSMTIIDACTGSPVGEVLRSQEPQPYATTTDPQTGQVFVVVQPSESKGAARAPAYLRQLDGTDGHILRTISLPHSGDEVALASHLDRLILRSPCLTHGVGLSCTQLSWAATPARWWWMAGSGGCSLPPRDRVPRIIPSGHQKATATSASSTPRQGRCWPHYPSVWTRRT
jgi:hypothetical protein